MFMLRFPGSSLTMQHKIIDGAAGRVCVVVLDPRDEAISALTFFAREHDLAGAQVTAIGAFRQATVGWFDRASQDYRRIPVSEQCEVLSLTGDVANGPDGPQLHLHAVLGLAEGTTVGGHLLEGLVWPTLEVVITEVRADLRKSYRPDVGLALIDLSK
jgi:hypothetical protein